MTRPHIVHVFPAFALGGPEVRTALLINESSDRFRHTVLSINGNLAGRALVNEDTGCEFLPAPPHKSNAGYPFVLAARLRELDADLILTNGWGGTDAVIAARLCGNRRVIHAEDGFLPDEAQRQRTHRLLVRKVVLKAAARVLVPSKTLLQIASQTWGLPARKIRYIPNGVDTNRFAPATEAEKLLIRKQLGLPVDRLLIGSVGHLREDKQQGRLIRALAALISRFQASLLILGEGSERAALETLARELGVQDQILLPGAVKEPSAHYRALDVFALSSNTEQMPLALLEAMSTSLPAVCTNVGDVRPMVCQENERFIVPVQDEKQLASRLEELLSDEELRRVIGAANREKCLKRFDVEEMIRAHTDLYREVLGLGVSMKNEERKFEN